MLAILLSVSNLPKHTKNHDLRVDDFDVILLNLSNCEIGKKRTVHGLCHCIDNFATFEKFHGTI